MSELRAEIQDWLDRIRARLRPWLRREPLPERPLVVAALALAAGCGAARFAVPGMSGPSLAAAWWGGAVVVLAAWWAAMRRQRRRLAAALLALAVAGAGAAWSAARFDLFPADDLAWRLGSGPVPVAVRGSVVESFRLLPTPTQDLERAAAIGPSSECVVAVEAVRVGSRWKPASGRAAVVVDGPRPDVVVGTRIQVLGRGLRPGAAANPGEFDFRLRARSQRTLSVVRVDSMACVRILSRPPPWSPAAALDRLRSAGVAVLHEHLAPGRAGLASALLLGARESLPREESDDFLVTGTVHVLSISGLHVGLLAAALFAVFRTLGIPRSAALAAVAACTGGYALLVGAETPVVRATLLVWLACLAASTGRRSAAIHALAVAAIVVLTCRPEEVFGAGAQLSFLSTAVLVGVAAALPRAAVPTDPIDRLIERSRPAADRWLRRRVWQAWVLFVCGLAVWAATGPLVAMRFHVVSPVGLVLNVLIAPLVALAMAAGFLCLLATPLPHAVAAGCGAACDAALAGIAVLREWGARLPARHAWLPGPPAWWTAGGYVLFASALLLIAPAWLARGRT
ncbi:MAG: ComEC/Rec2 family competence protein, partial [Planctomycetaceae bacterium]